MAYIQMVPKPCYGQEKEYQSCQWLHVIGKVLAESLEDETTGRVDAMTLPEAKQSCMRNRNCGGVTQKNKKLWTMRKGVTPMKSTDPRDADLESYVMLKGLCTCECSTKPPLCVWQEHVGERMGGGIERGLSCISPESDAALPGPRCSKDGSWMTSHDDTQYTEETAKERCELVNFKTLPPAHTCHGINKEEEGYTLRSGQLVYSGAGACALECVDYHKVLPLWQCSDYAQNTKVGCNWKRWEQVELPDHQIAYDRMKIQGYQ